MQIARGGKLMRSSTAVWVIEKDFGGKRRQIDTKHTDLTMRSEKLDALAASHKECRYILFKKYLMIFPFSHPTKNIWEGHISKNNNAIIREVQR